MSASILLSDTKHMPGLKEDRPAKNEFSDLASEIPVLSQWPGLFDPQEI